MSSTSDGADQTPKVTRIGRRRVTTSTGDEAAEPRADDGASGDSAEAVTAQENANDERLLGDRPPHWG